MKPVLFICLMLFTATQVIAQRPLPTIKAGSKSVDIREGNMLNRNAWTISPEIKPDIHFTSSLGKG